VRRALSSSDDVDLLRAERDVQQRLDELGLAVDLDFASMAVVASVLRVASAARGHLERTVLADAGLSFTAFTVMWVLWIWGRWNLVARRRDATDGRLVRVAATPAGDELMAGLFARFNEGETRIVSGLAADESRQLATLLRGVLRSVEEVDGHG
jgi:MarR family transcriptional regulator, organic hydroperoxide resistance regulator